MVVDDELRSRLLLHGSAVMLLEVDRSRCVMMMRYAVRVSSPAAGPPMPRRSPPPAGGVVRPSEEKSPRPAGAVEELVAGRACWLRVLHYVARRGAPGKVVGGRRFPPDTQPQHHPPPHRASSYSSGKVYLAYYY